MSGGEGENSIPLLLLKAKKVRWVPAGQKGVCPAVPYPVPPAPQNTLSFLACPGRLAPDPVGYL